MGDITRARDFILGLIVGVVLMSIDYIIEFVATVLWLTNTIH